MLSALRCGMMISCCACVWAGPVCGQDGAPAATPSLRQLAGASERGGAAGDTGADQSRLFEQLDRNADGRVTLDEIPETLRDRVRPLLDRLGTDALKPADLDRLNEISRQPARAARPLRGPAIFLVLDEDADGQISREELESAGDKFDRLDQDGNGAITPDELFALPGGTLEPSRARAAPSPASRPTNPRRPSPANEPAEPAETDEPSAGDDLASRLFRRYDRNGDGKLAPEEAPAALRQHFARFDVNGDGQIARDEFEKIASRPGKAVAGPQ